MIRFRRDRATEAIMAAKEIIVKKYVVRLSGEERVAAWQRDLSVAYSRIGDVSQAQGRLEAADWLTVRGSC
jgi:hypothetical protein